MVIEEIGTLGAELTKETKKKIDAAIARGGMRKRVGAARVPAARMIIARQRARKMAMMRLLKRIARIEKKIGLQPPVQTKIMPWD